MIAVVVALVAAALVAALLFIRRNQFQSRRGGGDAREGVNVPPVARRA